MILPYRLLAKELVHQNCWIEFIRYQRLQEKIHNNRHRIKFLKQCLDSELIPCFLRFRIPNNGCFEHTTVRNFQRKLLHREHYTAIKTSKSLSNNLNAARSNLRNIMPEKLTASCALYNYLFNKRIIAEIESRHKQKMIMLSKQQERPLLNVKNTVKIIDEDIKPPDYVLQVLSMGPKQPVLDEFRPKHLLAEVDIALSQLSASSTQDALYQINIATFQYIKECKKQRPDRKVNMTNRYLRENQLIAVPYDKGRGIC